MNELEKEANQLQIEVIKEELKNSIPNGEVTAVGHLLMINQALKDLNALKEARITAMFKNYRKAQTEQQKQQEEIQEKIIANAKGVYNNIMGL